MEISRFHEQITDSATVYSGKVIQVRVDSMRLSSGVETRREVVVHPDSVCAAALTPDGRLLLVRQYRRAADRILWEIPAGKMEPGEAPEQSLHRELQEECNVVCETLQKLATFYVSPGFCTERMHLYLATNCRPQPGQPDVDEIIDSRACTLDEAQELIDTEEMQDAKSLLAVAYLRARGLSHS